MTTIQDIIKSYQNRVCKKCSGNQFHINFTVRYIDGEEPYISLGDSHQDDIWCNTCEDHCTLVDPKADALLCENCDMEGSDMVKGEIDDA